MVVFRNYKFIDIVTLAYLLVLIFSDIIGTLHKSIPYFALLLWLFISYIYNNSAYKIIIKLKVSQNILIHCLILFVTSFIGASLISGINWSFAFLKIVSPIIVYSYYVYSNNLGHNQLYKLCSFLFIIIIFISLYSAKLQYENPDIGRYITAGDYESDEIAFGGVNFAAASAILSIFLLNFYKNYRFRTIKSKIIVLFSFCLGSIVVITSGSTISSIFLLIFIVISFIPSTKRTYTTLFIVLFLIVLYYGRSLWGELLISISQNIEDKTTAERISSIGYVLEFGTNNSGSEYFINRFGLPLKSFTTFLGNPIIGVAYKYGNDWGEAFKYGVYNHSEWFDLFAKFGLFGIFYYKVFSNQIKLDYRKNENKLWIYTWFCLGLFNPVVSSYSTFVTFLLIPSIKHKFLENNGI